MHVPHIFSFATRRGVRTKAVVIIMALVCTLFSGYTALAGQGPSQWCSDNGNNSEIHLANDPVTFNLEPGPYFGNPAYLITCYSTTPYGSAAPEVTGGNIWVNHSTQNVHCFSDPAAMVKIDCAGGTNVNTSNPTSPSASADAWGQATVLGTPAGAGVQSNCPYGYTAGTGGVGCGPGGVTQGSDYCSDGQWRDTSVLTSPVILGVELAPSPTYDPQWVALCYSTAPKQSGSNTPTGGLVGAWVSPSGLGNWCSPNSNVMVRVECSSNASLNTQNPTSPLASSYTSGQATVLGTPVSIQPTSTQAGVGCATGTIAISVTSCANGGQAGISGTGNSNGGMLALSGTGCATSSQYDGSVAASGGLSGCTTYGSIAANGMGDTQSHRIALSGTRNAYASTIAAISGTGYSGPAAGLALVTISGTGNSYGNAVAISGLGNATASGSGSNPGVAISGNGASGRDVAISLGQSASGTNGNSQASLVNISGGSGYSSVAGTTVYGISGLLHAPTSADQVADQAYQPPAEAVALKQLVEAAIHPEVVLNMATGLTETPGEGSSSSSSSMSSSSVPKVDSVNMNNYQQQHPCTCVPASAIAIVWGKTGRLHNEIEVRREMHTGLNPNIEEKCGTPFKSAEKVMNQNWFQNFDTFFAGRLKDASKYMSWVTTDINYYDHGMMNGVDPALLDWLGYPGSHANVTYGYDHRNGGKISIMDVWTGGKYPNQSLSEIWGAIASDGNEVIV